MPGKAKHPKKTDNIKILFRHALQEGRADETTCINTINALARCGDPDAAWTLYENEIPSELKTQSWAIHESVMAMVLRHRDRSKAHLLHYANTAYCHLMDADHPIEYDVIHALMLTIALAYDLIDQYVYSIYAIALYAKPPHKSAGRLAKEVYQACAQQRHGGSGRVSIEQKVEFQRAQHQDYLSFWGNLSEEEKRTPETEPVVLTIPVRSGNDQQNLQTFKKKGYLAYVPYMMWKPQPLPCEEVFPPVAAGPLPQCDPEEENQSPRKAVGPGS
ncbi:MAG TPA: hypothetical protein VLJ15_02810 [Gammaproteobacteria bacterium]|nr:hypothetical protein [Gammaproteobacteria bacterium]